MFAKIAISVFALGIAVLRIAVPSLRIDGITVVAAGIALVPWLSTIFKSVEIPGWLKVEFKYFQKAAKDAESAGLLSGPLTRKDKSQYSFQIVAANDPNLALAGLRIEIEVRMRRLAERHGLDTDYQGIGPMLRGLRAGKALTDREAEAIEGILELLNKAAHGARADANAAAWALEFGPRILKSLDDHVRAAGAARRSAGAAAPAPARARSAEHRGAPASRR